MLKKKDYFMILLLLLLSIGAIKVSFSLDTGSENYDTNVILDSGGASATSTNYDVVVAVSQFAIGEVSSTNYDNYLGILYAMGITGAGENRAPSTPTINLTPDNPLIDSDLYCNITINSTDTDGDKVNYTFIWYKNNTVNLTIQYTFDTLQVLGSGNTSYSELWNCTVIPFDGTVNGTPAMDSVFILANSPPSEVNLSYPLNNSAILNRTPIFNWTDAYDINGDTISYQLLIQRMSCEVIEDCVTDKINVTGILDPYYLPTVALDVDSVYNWSVRANDSQGYGPWSAVFNFTVLSLNAISLPTASIDFGEKTLGDVDNTTDDDPSPLVVQNDGNINVNITIYANQSLWIQDYANLNTSYFMFEVGNSTELNSFNYTESQLQWENVSSYARHLIKSLKYADSNDSAEIDIYIKVPLDELPGTKLTGLVIESVRS